MLKIELRILAYQFSLSALGKAIERKNTASTFYKKSIEMYKIK